MSYAPRILIVDDEREVRDFFKQALSEDGYYVTAVGTARQGLNALGDGEFQVVVLDLSLPDGDGLEVVRQIRGEHPNLSILAISGFNGREHETLRLLRVLSAIRILCAT